MPRLLTDQQIALVAERVRDGETLRDATIWCKEAYGIKPSHQTLHGYPEIRKALTDRSTANKIDSNEKLEKARPGILDGMLKCINKNSARREKIEEALESLTVKSREYLNLADELRKLETEFFRYSKEFHVLHEKSTLKEADVQGSLSASASEKLKHLKTQMAPVQTFPKEGESFSVPVGGDTKETN